MSDDLSTASATATAEVLSAARQALVYAVGTANGLIMIRPNDPDVLEEIELALDTLAECRNEHKQSSGQFCGTCGVGL
jgi:hypothetical protein